MLAQLRAMPGGVRIFLGYAFLILGAHRAVPALGRRPGDQRADLPVGVVAMVLLAYTIFTTTLVLQRKEASRAPRARPVDAHAAGDPARCCSPAQPLFALIVALLAALLFFGLTRPEVRTWLSEP